MMAEVEFSEGSTGIYASTNYAGQYTQLGQEFEKIRSKVEVDTANNDSLCGVHFAGETLEDLIGGPLPHRRWSRGWSVGWFTDAVSKMPMRVGLHYTIHSTAELIQQIFPTSTLRAPRDDGSRIMQTVHSGTAAWWCDQPVSLLGNRGRGS